MKSSIMPSIAISNLTKRYTGADIKALDDVSLAVQPGEVYGFLGPNGAGKSTAIRILMNFIQPSDGHVEILGHDSVKDSVVIKKSVGYLSGDSAVYPRMTGQQFLDYMHDLQPAIKKSYIAELAKRMHADLNKKLGELSRGNRQKIGIIQAFMHQPQVIILDEPSSGLDPLMQEVFYELIKESKQRGAAIFMSSHILSEVQKVCDRVGIIREGKLIGERNIDEMASEAAQTFDIAFKGKAPLAALKQVKGVRIISHDKNQVTIHMHGPLSPLFNLLGREDVVGIDAHRLDIEEMFMRYYGSKESAV